MAKKDDLLRAFLLDPIMKEKYNVSIDKSINMKEALNSDILIINTIANIVDKYSNTSDQTLYNEIINYLNSKP